MFITEDKRVQIKDIMRSIHLLTLNVNVLLFIEF